MQLKAAVDVVVHCVVQGCDFSDHEFFAGLLSDLEGLVVASEVVLVAKANAGSDLAEGFLIDNHPDRLHFWLYFT